MSNFCTSIHCMDGRIQIPVIHFLWGYCNVKYVDIITEAGPCKILAENNNKILIDSIIERVNISIIKHGSKLITVSGHYDCAGNPVDKATQIEQIIKSIQYCKKIYPNIEIIGLWIDDRWKINCGNG